MPKLNDSITSDIKGKSNVFKEMNKTTKEHINIKRQYEILKKRVELLKNQEEKLKKENIIEKKKEEEKKKIIQERKKEKENINNYFIERAKRIKNKKEEIKEKYKEENKIFKSVNEEILKKNKKQYNSLKNEKEILEKKKKEKAEEILEQNKIRVNAIKKVEDKEKEITNDKNSVKSNRNDKYENETFDTVLSPQQKKNYLQSKDYIEQYKNKLEELMKQEKEYMEKLNSAKKMPKKRSISEVKMKVVNKDVKNRTKSHYKDIVRQEVKLEKKNK